MPRPPLLIAAPASGCGKTTVTLALLAALRRRGLAVAPFKVGPDYLDPGHHAAAAGRSSRNLDSWMGGEEGVRESYRRGTAGADLAVIEGVMGLFDGAAGASDVGSSAEIARWLGARVVLVVDARAQARSAAALVQGFARFDPRLEFAGVLFNRVGSARHHQLLRQAIASVPDLPPVLGCLPRRDELTLPERHLGLVTAAETARPPGWADALADWFEEGCDPLALVPAGSPFPPAALPTAPAAATVRIGVARDEAFCFHYPENLEALETAGAELVFFSPLRVRQLPPALDGLYLGGGYPELHAERLSANRSLLEEIRRGAEGGLPIYAECGGLMLLVAAIDGRPMAGVLPGTARMLHRRRALGYREVTTTATTLLGPAGTRIRGHEFHYSETLVPPAVPRAYRVARADGEALADEGYLQGQTLASYIHLSFAGNPEPAENFVRTCRERAGRTVLE